MLVKTVFQSPGMILSSVRAESHSHKDEYSFKEELRLISELVIMKAKM